MRDLKRLIYMLLLNVIVSLTVTLVVLFFWQRSQRTASLFNDRLAEAAVTVFATFTPQPTQTSPATSTEVFFLTPSVPPEPQKPPPPTATIRAEIYQVKAGDTLGTIASQFKVSINDLIILNELSDPDTLSIGQELLIPLEPLPPPAPQPTDTEPPLQPTDTRPPRTATPLVEASATPQAAQPQVVISSVIGYGDLDTERVVISRTGEGELSLADWQLSDSNGNVYTFPQLNLYQDGAVNLHTRQGLNTVVDLFWGLDHAIWSQGEKVTLKDPQGEVKATFSIP
jgi:LysM repeat protein